MHDPHQEFFDRLAEEWDLQFTSEDLERLAHLVEKFAVKPGMQVLDLGCGTGILFDMLRRRVGQNGSVTGVDFSFKMARQAHRNFPFANVHVVDADVLALPFRDSVFDIATVFAAFAHFADKRLALGEIHRVLKPKGRLYIIHLASSKELGETHRLIGGAVAQDTIPTRDDLSGMFNTGKFEQVVIDDRPGLFLATAVNHK